MKKYNQEEVKRWHIFEFRKMIVGGFALFVMFATWAISSPVGSSPDDDYHLPSIWCANGPQKDVCSLNGDVYTTPGGVANASICYAFDPYKTAECTRQALEGDATSQNYINNNNKWYPELYYKTMNLMVSEDVLSSILRIRLLNSALFVLFLFWFLSLRNNTKTVSAMKLTSVLLFMPLGMFIIPSTNPSSWSFIFGFFYVFGLYSLFNSSGQDTSVKIFVATTGILFLGARADSGGYLIAITVSVSLALRQKWSGVALSKWLIPITLIIGGFYNLAVYMGAKVIGNGLTEASDLDTPYRDPVFLFLTNLVRLPELFMGNFGTRGLGWLDTVPPLIVPITVFGLILTSIVKSSGFSLNQGTSLAVFTLLFFPLYVLQKGSNIVGEHVQPRYLLPLMVLVFASIIMSFDEIYQSKVQYYFFLFLMVVVNGISLWTNMSRYSTGIGGNIFKSNLAWQWPGTSTIDFFIIGMAGSLLFYSWALQNQSKEKNEVAKFST